MHASESPAPRRTLSILAEDALSLEVYRQLYVSLSLPVREQPAPVIGVTSAISGEGRTTIALGLAQTLALDLDVPITLVEVDLDRPALAAYFGIPGEPGLAEVLRGACRLQDAACLVSTGLSLVPAGGAGPDAARLLRQLSEREPFHDPAGVPGIMVLDLPPIINHSYTALAATVVDALVLVVRAGVTPIPIVREAIARLEDHPPRGIVLNSPRSALPAWWPAGSGRGTEIGREG